MLNQAFLFCHIFCVRICFFCVLNTITPAALLRLGRPCRDHVARGQRGLVARAEANLAVGVGHAARLRVVREYAEEGVREGLEVLRLEDVLVVEEAGFASG